MELVYLALILAFVVLQMWGPWRRGWRLSAEYRRAPDSVHGQHRVLLTNGFRDPVAFHWFDLIRSKKRSTADMLMVSERVEGGPLFTIEPRSTREVIFRDAADWQASERPRRDYGRLYLRVWPIGRTLPVWLPLDEV